MILQDDGSKATASAAELGLANVGGIFVVLIMGGSVAFFIAVFEFFWKSRKLALEGVDGGNGSIWRNMMEELKLAMNCSTDTKAARPLRRRLNDSSSK